MFNALNRFSSVIILSILFFSCSDSEKKEAQALFEEANAQFEAGEYAQALESLDSLDSKYKGQVEIRRDGMHLRPRIIERKTLIELESTDSLLAQLSIESEALKESLELVPDGFEGYYTTKSLAGKIPAQKEGLYARMSPDGLFYVVSSAKKGTESTAVRISSNGREATTLSVENDGERNDRSRGVEIITFMPNECDSIGKFALETVGNPLEVTFIGRKNYTIKLDAAQANALADVYQGTTLFLKLRSAQLEKTRLERQLDIARSQAARTYREKE